MRQKSYISRVRGVFLGCIVLVLFMGVASALDMQDQPNHTLSINSCTGILTVTSSPAGASLYIDGTYRGLTPATIQGVLAGRHSIRLILNRFSEMNDNLSITCNAKMTMHYTLDKNPSAEVMVKPVQAHQEEMPANVSDTYLQNLSSVGDNAQMANMDLQNTRQKTEQFLQMISNIAKLLTDTMNSILKNIGD